MSEQLVLPFKEKKIALIDGDKPLHAVTSSCQTVRYKAIHKQTKEEFTFDGKKGFNEWIKSESALSSLDFDHDYYVAEVEPLENCLHSVRLCYEGIISHPWMKEAWLFIHGSGNWRIEKATLFPYKGQRKEKPVLFDQAKEYLIKKFNPIIVEGVETDDAVAQWGYSGYLNAYETRDKEENPYVICSPDKDLKTVPGWYWNYDKPEIPPEWVDEWSAWKFYCKQILMGDAADNIKGLNGMTTGIIEKYGIRNGTKGCGEVSAEKIISSCKNKADTLDVLKHCYREVYGNEWLDILRENALLLRMEHYVDEHKSFDFGTYYE